MTPGCTRCRFRKVVDLGSVLRCQDHARMCHISLFKDVGLRSVPRCKDGELDGWGFGVEYPSGVSSSLVFPSPLSTLGCAWMLLVILTSGAVLRPARRYNDPTKQAIFSALTETEHAAVCWIRFCVEVGRLGIAMHSESSSRNSHPLGTAFHSH